MNARTIRKLAALGACSGAIEWCESKASETDAWVACRRGDRMLWILMRTAADRGSALHRRVVLAGCECARLALPDVPEGETRPRAAIETTERWANGEPGVTVDNVRHAGAAAEAAYAYAHVRDYFASYACRAAANAAIAAYIDDIDAAYSAAADAAYSSDTRAKTLARCADIVRRHFPEPPVLSEVENEDD